MKKVTMDDQVEFVINDICLNRNGDTTYVCEFSGQFLKNRKPLNPPLGYYMYISDDITTDNLYKVLAPIYFNWKTNYR